MRILVAEDDQVSALVFRRTLEDAGHTVVLARDGEEALRAARVQRFDAIVTDWLMPRKDGMEFVKELQKGQEIPPVLVVTALGSAEARRFALEVGADDYLAKPCTPQSLLDRLALLLDEESAPAGRGTKPSGNTAAEQTVTDADGTVYVREALFAEYRPLVRRLMCRYGQDAEVRQDLEGEIYLQFFRLLQEYDPRRGIPFRAYVVSHLPHLVYSVMRGRWRRENRETPLAPEKEALLVDESNPFADLDLGLSAEQLKSHIDRAIDLLPERQRQIVIERYYQHKDYEAIAAAMDLKPASVRSLLRTGLNTLRSRLAYLNAEG